MKRNIKLVESSKAIEPYSGPYQQIAAYVRDLLKCDYALVALPEKDSIRIQGFAGGHDEAYANVAGALIARLRDWGPVVVDDARLIAAPVSCGRHVMGVLIGYSSTAGTFTAADLDKLTQYSRAAAGILSNAAIESKRRLRTPFSMDELLHYSRLITMGELSACFAHEVANPLTLIRGHLRFIDEGLPADHPLKVNFEVIDRASRRIEDMARRMLDFGKKKPSRLERCDIAELLTEALRFVQPFLRTNFIEVQLQLQPNLPDILVDRPQLVQTIVNLVQNAADAMAEAEERVLSITADDDEGRLRLVIADTGVGIAADNVAKIFDPFFTTKGARGTGLGLYITKQAIENHRGTINVESSDRGTTFVISLPL
jgi:signal transduction histidine kinase